MANNLTIESLLASYHPVKIGGTEVTNLTDFKFNNIELIKLDQSHDISSILITKTLE